MNSAKLANNMSLLDTIPLKIKKTTTQIKVLDKKLKKIRKNIQKKTCVYLLGEYRPDVKFQAIDRLYQRAMTIQTRKTKLAHALYNSVDRDIVLFDKANQELHANKIRSPSAFIDRDGRTSSRGKNAIDRCEPFTCEAGAISVGDIDMPVDPNEPEYCICHQVSYGEMIMCDNADCKTEWFHFPCVGLSVNPKGKWYCEECRHAEKKVNRQR